MKRLDLKGKKSGRLFVVGPYKVSSDRVIRWKCKCKCGKEKWIIATNIQRKLSKSCGCSRRKKRGGLTHTALGRAYYNAKRRCTDDECKDYKNYGGRGIEFRFSSFQEFVEELGKKPSKDYSLDRIDPDGHYEKGNVRWATKIVQNRNKRKWVDIHHFPDEQLIKEVKRRGLVIT